MSKLTLRQVLPVLVATLLNVPDAARAGDPDSTALAAYVEAAMREWQVPGVAMAVVRDDRVVMARGFGVRGAGREAVVDVDTLFPIASLTKGFTATLAAVEVAAGRLAWDRRVIDSIPGFSVADPWVTREVRLDDLLTHRTGWQPEVDFLWMIGLDRDAILARMGEVEQGEGLRAGYTYLNVPYLIAGEAIARGSGSSYTALLRERLLTPLGMTATRVTSAEVSAVTNRISPHSDFDGVVRPVALEDSDPVAPAAALHSTVEDMARWLRFHLGDGSLDGQRLLTSEQLAELHEPRTLIPRGPYFRGLYPGSHFQAYARGWVVQDHVGRTVVWNTGGLFGTACSIALVPEERLGVVVLTNGPRISLPEALVFRTLDAWLGAPPRDWSKERLNTSLAARGRAAEAAREQESKQDATAAARLGIEGYAGTYRAPLLGELEVSTGAAGLRVALGKLTGTATHWRHDAFVVAWDNAFYGTNVVTFALDAEARPVRIEVEGVGAFERAKAGS